MYTKEYMKHFSSPVNVGEMKEADAVEDVHYKGQGCFDKVRIFVKLDGKKIARVTYQTRGCSGTIAACSAMSEMVTGMVLEGAVALTGSDIAATLGGVPEKKQHSMDLAAEALRTALQKFNS